MSFLCALPLAAQFFGACAPAAPLAVGYVEGDYVLLAPIEVAQVASVAVRRGDRVEAGKPIAALESDDARIEVAQAEAALAGARAQLVDLQVGKRPEEIAVLEATLRSTQAQVDDADRTLTRTQDLLKRGVATQAQYDDAATQAEVEQAIRRVADKLLHHPTVRVKELANETGAVSYADALARLFALDPDAVAAVTQVDRR